MSPALWGGRRVLSLLIGGLVLTVGAVLVTRHAAALRAAAVDIGPGALAASTALAALGTVLIFQVWSVLLAGLGAAVGNRGAAGVFFLSQLGKYVPGSVWPVVAQMEFGHQRGIPRRTMLTANLLMLSLLTATGLVVGAALLPWSSSGGLSRYWWTLAALIPLGVLLHPRTIPAALDLLLGLVGRERLGVRASSRSMLVATLWSFGVWVLMGLHVLVLTRALGATGVTAAAAAVGGMALGWAAGLILVPAPAGAGVRDAVLVATFAPQIGSAPALAVALASRVVLILVDVALAGIGAGALATRHRRPEASRPSEP